jgi:hypothetical protein
MHASCHPLRAAIEEVNAPLFIEILSAAFRIIPFKRIIRITFGY